MRVPPLSSFGSSLRPLLDYRIFTLILTALVLVLKLLIINTPAPKLPPSECIRNTEDCGFVFDEAHYVPAIRRLLAGEAVNNEHPPLSKALFILGVMIFGDGPLGWRFFPAISGALSIYIISLLAFELTRNNGASIAAAILYMGDVMTFNISSIAILDAPSLLFLLAGSLLLLRGRMIMGSLLLGLSVLAKASALFSVLAIVVFVVIKRSAGVRTLRAKVDEGLGVSAASILIVMSVFLAGLAVYDYSLRAFATPFAHLDYMLTYHSGLTFNCVGGEPPFYCIHRDSQSEKTTIVDLPLSWTVPFKSFSPAPYYVVEVSDGGPRYRPVAYYGVHSPLWWVTWVIVAISIPPLISVAGMTIKGKEIRSLPGLELMAFIWIAANYFVYFPIAYLLSRWVYPFYFFNTLPILAIATAGLLWERGLPRLILYLLIAAQLTWFFIWFPVKSDIHILILRTLGLPA